MAIPSFTASPDKPTRDAFGDLEYSINDCRDMCNLVVRLFDEGGESHATGGVTIAQPEWDELSFALHHLQGMVGGLFRQYHGE